MTIRELFDFIVDPTISDESVDTYLEEVYEALCCHIFSSMIFIFFPSISIITFASKELIQPWNINQVQQKILARGDVISAEEQIADSVFVQVPYLLVIHHVYSCLPIISLSIHCSIVIQSITLSK